MMPKENPGFEIVGGTEAEPQATNAQIVMLTIALKALSQRALVALMDMFCLITCTGAWALWYMTPSPTLFQIIHNTIFAVFVLAANWIVRTRK
jgi:hypothetical protein